MMYRPGVNQSTCRSMQWGMALALSGILMMVCQLGTPAPVQACGIGQPFTMMANAVPAVSYPATQMTLPAPLGVFPQEFARDQPITLAEDTSGAPRGFDPFAYSWQWEFGDGTQSTGFPVVHQYERAGTFVIQVGIISRTDPSFHVRLFDSAQITIVPRVWPLPPVAIARSSVTYVQVGSSVTYDASSSYAQVGHSLNWSWNFGDTQTAEGARVAHTFEQIGSGYVALVVQDDRGARAFALLRVVVVSQLPIARWVVTPTAPVAGASVRFDASLSRAPVEQGNHIADYFWDFGDGVQWEGIDPIVTHLFARPGSYAVTLRVTDMQGLPGTTTQMIVVVTAAQSISETSTNQWSTFLLLTFIMIAAGAALSLGIRRKFRRS